MTLRLCVNLSIRRNNDFAGAAGNWNRNAGAAGPLDSQCLRFAARGQHQARRVLRPVSATGMDFMSGTATSVRVKQSINRPDAVRISRRPFQANTQTGSGADVAIEPRCVCILPNDEIEPPVVIVVTERRAPAFTVDFQPAFLARNCLESAPPVAFEPQPASGIGTGGL